MSFAEGKKEVKKMKTINGKIAIAAMFIILVSTGMATAASWDYGTSLQKARHGLDVIEYNNKIYAIGGWYSTTSQLTGIVTTDF